MTILECEHCKKIADEFVEFVAVDSEVLEQFCVMTTADERVVEAVAGLEIVIAVAELEFQYL